MLVLDPTPKKNREETKDSLNRIITGPRPLTEGPLLVSDIPKWQGNKDAGVIMGIDEAGRGPELGPMTYAAAYWSEDATIPTGYNDSKQISSQVRSELYDATIEAPNIGFVIRVLHATEISQKMLRKVPYNLNNMSHDAAMQMVQVVLDAGVKIKKCFIDTVGNEDAYKAKLNKRFPDSGVEFIVEKKADAKYKPCSAASVLAKVTRDSIIEKWSFSEPHFKADLSFGSGYPSDPKCKSWMEKNLQDPIFGYPNLVRFSWAPVKDRLNENAVKVEWEADEEEEESQRNIMAAFIKGDEIQLKEPRLDYFQRNKLKRKKHLPFD